MHTEYFFSLPWNTQGSIGYNPSPIHSCIHTLIPATSWQDVASIHPHSGTATESHSHQQIWPDLLLQTVSGVSYYSSCSALAPSDVTIVLTMDTVKRPEMWSCGRAVVLWLPCCLKHFHLCVFSDTQAIFFFFFLNVRETFLKHYVTNNFHITTIDLPFYWT